MGSDGRAGCTVRGRTVQQNRLGRTEHDRERLGECAACPDHPVRHVVEVLRGRGQPTGAVAQVPGQVGRPGRVRRGGRTRPVSRYVDGASRVLPGELPQLGRGPAYRFEAQCGDTRHGVARQRARPAQQRPDRVPGRRALGEEPVVDAGQQVGGRTGDAVEEVHHDASVRSRTGA